MGLSTWRPIIIVFLAGSLATAIVPQTVPILGEIAKAFHADNASLSWIISFPTLACAIGALAFGVVVDRIGEVRLLLVGIGLVILGDLGASLAPALQWLFAARLLQGLGYVSITVAGPTFIQRITSGDLRRAAMAFWAAHTPAGFAAAVFIAAHLLAAGFSWRSSFLGHAGAAVLIGAACLVLRSTPAASTARRSLGTRRVLSSPPAYAVAVGALSSAMLQVSVMVLVPRLLEKGHGLSGPQAALVIVFAMLATWIGSMIIVATRVRNFPMTALPVTSACAALFGFLTATEWTRDLTIQLACVMAFGASIGTANALIWSLLPAATPSPEAAGATAGLVTQASFLGVLIGPPLLFWLRQESPMLIALLALLQAVLMLMPLIAYTPPELGGGAHGRTARSHCL